MNKNMRKEIIGIPSGDYDSFCIDVDIDNFIKIKERCPDELEKSLFNSGTYRIYPNDLFKDCKKGLIKLTIETVDSDKQ